MGREIRVDGLPYRTRVYINNQVLLSSGLVRALGLENALYVDVVLEHEGRIIELRGVKLLHNGRALSRQFTIPKETREVYGIKPLDEVRIVSIRYVSMVSGSDKGSDKNAKHA